MKAKKPFMIDSEELTMAKLAGEFNTTLKVHLELHKPSKPRKKKKLTRAQGIKARVLHVTRKGRGYSINPYDALTMFDVTITGQVLDIPLKSIHRSVMISRVDSIVEDTAQQLQWVVMNRLQELKMKYDYEKPFTIKIDKDMM